MDNVRQKTVVDSDIVWLEVQSAKGKHLGYYKKSNPTQETALDHPKIQREIKKLHLDPWMGEAYPLDGKVSIPKDVNPQKVDINEKLWKQGDADPFGNK